jgi:hypothetical protein
VPFSRAAFTPGDFFSPPSGEGPKAPTDGNAAPPMALSFARRDRQISQIVRLVKEKFSIGEHFLRSSIRSDHAGPPEAPFLRAHPRKRVAHGARRAPRRQYNGDARQAQRIAAGHFQQPAGQRR